MTSRLLVAHTADLGAPLLGACERLVRTVFADAGDPLDDHDWGHCLGGVHAVVLDGDEPVAHGSVVLRRLLHAGRALRCGYVEGVAVAAAHRRQGHLTRVMDALERLVRDGCEVGALGSTDEALPIYLARGWEVWPGSLAVLTPDGVVPTPDEQGWVLVLPGSALLERSAALVADWRDGEVW